MLVRYLVLVTPTTDRSASNEGPEARVAERSELVEEMGLLWEELGFGRMWGRIICYLMLSEKPYVSSAELRDALRASAGAISEATRMLKDLGFVRQIAVPGERSHFYRVDDDIWGTFLAQEGKLYRRTSQFAERALAVLGDDEREARTRFENMRDYHEWLETHRKLVLESWEHYKLQRGQPVSGQPATRLPRRDRD